MNSLYKFILAVIAGTIVFSACTDDERVKIPDFENGAIPYFIKDPTLLTFIDLVNFNNTVLRFSVDFTDTTTNADKKSDVNLEFSDVDRIDVLLAYRNGSQSNLPKENIAMIGTTTEWPVVLELVADDIKSAFPSEIFTEDSLKLGDVFQVAVDIYLNDGRVLEGFVPGSDGGMIFAYSPSLQGNLNSTTLTYAVSCPSDLASSTVYNVSCEVKTTCCGLPTGVYTGTTATVTDLGEGDYEISDFMANYLTTAGIPAGDEPIIVTDVCNIINVNPNRCSATSVLCYVPTTDGSYDPNTDTWVLEWVDAFGNNISGTTTLTPQ